jgi:hypothetical protein
MTSRLARYKNRRVIGPGTWYVGHLVCEQAVESGTLSDFQVAYGVIDTLRHRFACLNCRHHIEEYCRAYPPEIFRPVVNTAGITQRQHDSSGLALWFYGLHQAANRSANNPGEAYEDVINFFRGDEVCSTECEEEEPTSPEGSNSAPVTVSSAPPGIQRLDRVPMVAASPILAIPAPFFTLLPPRY